MRGGCGGSFKHKGERGEGEVAGGVRDGTRGWGCGSLWVRDFCHVQ